MNAWRTAHMAPAAISMHWVSLVHRGVQCSAMLGPGAPPEHSHARTYACGAWQGVDMRRHAEYDGMVSSC